MTFLILYRFCADATSAPNLFFFRWTGQTDRQTDGRAGKESRPSIHPSIHPRTDGTDRHLPPSLTHILRLKMPFFA